MCLAIDILLSGLLLVLYHQLDVYGFNIPNYFGSLGWWDRRIQFKLMCLTIDVLPSGLLLVLSHQLDVYGFNIPNYFGSLGWWDRKYNINLNAFNNRYIPKWSAACIVSPARCLWIEHTKLFWFLWLMKPEKFRNGNGHSDGSFLPGFKNISRRTNQILKNKIWHFLNVFIFKKCIKIVL